jgi:hypothetical protein
MARLSATSQRRPIPSRRLSGAIGDGAAVGVIGAGAAAGVIGAGAAAGVIGAGAAAGGGGIEIARLGAATIGGETGPARAKRPRAPPPLH